MLVIQIITLTQDHHSVHSFTTMISIKNKHFKPYTKYNNN